MKGKCASEPHAELADAVAEVERECGIAEMQRHAEEATQGVGLTVISAYNR